jgi:hypothetical protein
LVEDFGSCAHGCQSDLNNQARVLFSFCPVGRKIFQ